MSRTKESGHVSESTLSTHCNMLQHAATRYNTLHHPHTPVSRHSIFCGVCSQKQGQSVPAMQSLQSHGIQCVAMCCSVLQCVAVCCSALQCVAVRCSVLQCVADTASWADSAESALQQSLQDSASRSVPARAGLESARSASRLFHI